MWFFALIVVVLIGAVAVVASGRWGAMSTAYDDRPDMSVPARQALTSDDLETARFGVGLRGYRMDEVDTLLERVAREVAERDRRIADLERAVTPIMHGPEGAGFAPRNTYGPDDFDDTGYQLPIMVGGNFPEPPTAQATQAETPPAADPQVPPADAHVQPAVDAPLQQPAEPQAWPAAEGEPQQLPAVQVQPSADPQAPPADAHVQPAVDAQLQQAADEGLQQPAAAQLEPPVEPQAQPAIEPPVWPGAEGELQQSAAQAPQDERQQVAEFSQAPLPPVPPEPVLQAQDSSEQGLWFQEPAAPALQAHAQQPPAVHQPDQVQPAVEQPESAQPAVEQPAVQEQRAQDVVQGQAEQGGVREQAERPAVQGQAAPQVSGQLWADPGAAVVQAANGQQEGQATSEDQQDGENGQAGDQAPRGRHSATPDENALQRPN